MTLYLAHLSKRTLQAISRKAEQVSEPVPTHESGMASKMHPCFSSELPELPRNRLPLDPAKLDSAEPPIGLAVYLARLPIRLR